MLTAADLIWGSSAAARALETRHVRTPAGAKRYGLPIGSPIEAASKAAGKGAKAAAGAGRALSHEDVVAHAHTLSDEDLARLHEAIAELHHGRQAKAAVVAHAPGAEHGGSVEGRMSVPRTPPDISRHVTALEGHRSRLQPGNTHAPAEAARTHLADVKGAELNALAKHYGHGTAGTAAQKRQRILQAAVGRRADSLAIQHASLKPTAGMHQSPSHPAEHAADLVRMSSLTREQWRAMDGAGQYRTVTDLERIAKEGTPPQRAEATQILDRIHGRDVDRARRQELAPVEAAVFQAYRELKHPNSDYVDLARLRTNLDQRGFSRAQVDEVLRDLRRRADAGLVPESNQKMLTAADRSAAVHVGGQDQHLIYFETGYRPPDTGRGSS